MNVATLKTNVFPVMTKDINSFKGNDIISCEWTIEGYCFTQRVHKTDALLLHWDTKAVSWYTLKASVSLHFIHKTLLHPKCWSVHGECLSILLTSIELYVGEDLLGNASWCLFFPSAWVAFSSVVVGRGGVYGGAGCHKRGVGNRCYRQWLTARKKFTPIRRNIILGAFMDNTIRKSPQYVHNYFRL